MGVPNSVGGMTDHPAAEIVHRELDIASNSPAVEVAQAVADIEEKDSTELTTLYDCVDGMLDELFSTPPSPEAQMQVEFSYEGYRITIDQDGVAEFVKTE